MQKENKVPVDWQVFSCDMAVVTVSVAASLTACSSLCRRVKTHLQSASVSCSPKNTRRNKNYLGCNLQAGTNATSILGQGEQYLMSNSQSFFLGIARKQDPRVRTPEETGPREAGLEMSLFFFLRGDGFWRQPAPEGAVWLTKALGPAVHNDSRFSGMKLYVQECFGETSPVLI